MDYKERIPENLLPANYEDGEVLQHTDMNRIELVIRTAVNENYKDIQKLQDGTLASGNSSKLSNATLSIQENEELQDSDTKVPSSRQVKTYIDLALRTSIDAMLKSVSGYDEGKIQILQNTNGNITWEDKE